MSYRQDNTPPDSQRVWRSCAEWPEGCCPTIGNFSDDWHESEAGAKAVLNLLSRYGFGGCMQFFPVKTWVEHHPVKKG